MYQTTDFIIPDEKLLVVANITSNPHAYFWNICFPEGRLADMVRKMVKQDLSKTEGNFVLNGYEIKGEPADAGRSRAVTLYISWKTSPLWWSNHPKWHKAPFCGEEVPEDGWFAEKIRKEKILDAAIPVWR